MFELITAAFLTTVAAPHHIDCPMSGTKYGPTPLTLMEATTCVAHRLKLANTNQVVLMHNQDNTYTGIVVLPSSTLSITVVGTH